MFFTSPKARQNTLALRVLRLLACFQKGMIATIVRMVRNALQRYLDGALGGILLMAGALKAQQILEDPSVGQATGFPRELLIGASIIELMFGCWLLVGLYRRPTRWLALAWFTSLAAVALAQAVGGAPSCPCFGELHPHPWFMFLFDVGAVGALWLWAPVRMASGGL